VLASLLQRNHGLRPDFGGGLANHVSMGLYSLSALGADAAQLERFADAHGARLEPLPAEPGPAIGADAWKARLGQRDAINGYRALFTQSIARHGRDATLRKYLPDLLPGIGCDAFHALIRTGYGVRFGDDREVADGLAYWAIAFVPLGPLGPVGREREPRALLESVHATLALAGRDPPGHERLIHLIPLLLGAGVRLFHDLGPELIELRKVSAVDTPRATHFRFEVVK
jgi:Questin oxidase-like